MRLIVIIVAIVVILVGGGILSSGMLQETDILVQQTNSPEASFFEATPDQAAWLFVIVGFIIFNVIGAGVTIMLVIWFLDRSLKSSQAQADAPAVATE